MGEKKDGAKNGGDNKKASDAGGAAVAAGKKDDGIITAVFKIDMHCDGCAKKIKRAVKHFDGVATVKADSDANKLTVTGKVDPTALKVRLERKTKKKVDILSPQPKKDCAAGKGGEKKVDGKAAGKVDPTALKERLEQKTKKKVDILSPQPKKDGAAGGGSEKKVDGKAEKKADHKKPQDQKPKESTLVLKIRLHCDGWSDKIRKIVKKIAVEVIV